MNRLKELCKQFKDVVNYVPVYCSEQYEELQKYSELCGLTNAIADLSSGGTARALDYTIKEIAYASAEPNFEVRKMYLSEAIKDLLSGMDEVDMLWKYDMILYNLQCGDELEKVDMFLKEIHWYEQCDKNKGDKCEHSRCKYCVLTLGQGSELSCGRKSL